MTRLQKFTSEYENDRAVLDFFKSIDMTISDDYLIICGADVQIQLQNDEKKNLEQWFERNEKEKKF